MLRLTLICGAVIAVLFTACESQQEPSAQAAEVKQEITHQQKVEMGHRLVEMLDCNICHTPKVMSDMGPVPDTTRRLSGYPADLGLPELDASIIGPGKWVLADHDHFGAWAGPWGVSFAANLTPDETGIGNWTLEHFVTAIRQGKSKGLANGRGLLPPMPWQAYNYATDEELEAIFTYLKSLKPVKNLVPTPIPPTEI